jgi:hypothetical protein
MLFAFTPAFAARALAQRVSASERRRYLDPATEFEVYRHTSPSYTSVLPRPYNRVFSKRDGFLLYASDRSGSLQAYALALKSGQSRQLTEASELDPSSLTLTPDERGICYAAGGVLWVSPAGGGRARSLGELGEDWSVGGGIGATPDGPSVLAQGAGRLL